MYANENEQEVQELGQTARKKDDMKAADATEETADRENKEAQKGLKEEKDSHHEIHFSVDGESYETKDREMTPDEIIREYGGKDPTSNYLVQIEGGHKISYKDKGSESIKLHNGMQFQIISTGPTPVSDGPIRTGIELFISELRDLGYSPVPLPGKSDHVVIDYEVQTGCFAGKKVRQGFIIPADFPMTPPSGPHVSPHIHPIKSEGGHPTGAVHRSHSQPFEAGAGGEWQYWSRPFSDWAQSKKKSAAVYMSHVWRLWDSQ